MLTDLKNMMSHSTGAFMQDLIGAAALMVMLVVGLHLPNFI